MEKYTKSLDPTTKKRYDEYCQQNVHSSFQNLKTGFENYVMNLEASALKHITLDPVLHRDYRAYMREHYNRLEEPWSVAFQGFKRAFLMKPERYRDFVVIGPEAKQRVVDFYRWLDNVHIFNTGTKFNSEMTDKELSEIEKKAYVLYRQKDMWRRIKKGKPVGNWLTELKKYIVDMIRKQLVIQRSIVGRQEQRNYYIYEINRVIIKFHKCFQTKEFPFGIYENFLKATIRKTLEMAVKEGVPESICLLAKIRPDLFTEHTYPWINIKSDLYLKTDYTRLNSVKQFSRLAWCQEYMKSERQLV